MCAVARVRRVLCAVARVRCGAVRCGADTKQELGYAKEKESEPFAELLLNGEVVLGHALPVVVDVDVQHPLHIVRNANACNPHTLEIVCDDARWCACDDVR